MIGLYRPGTSLVHSAPALLKLAVLAVLMVLVGVVADPVLLAGEFALVLALYALAGVPPLAAWPQIGPILWILVFAVPVQVLVAGGSVAGWTTAGLMAGRLLVAVALAALFTLSTTVTAVLEAFQIMLRPFRRWVDADRVGLLVALTIRCIPLVAEIVREVLEARRARGAQASVVALAVPVVVRSLYAADAIGEALAARGLDD